MSLLRRSFSQYGRSVSMSGLVLPPFLFLAIVLLYDLAHSTLIVFLRRLLSGPSISGRACLAPRPLDSIVSDSTLTFVNMAPLRSPFPIPLLLSSPHIFWISPVSQLDGEHWVFRYSLGPAISVRTTGILTARQHTIYMLCASSRVRHGPAPHTCTAGTWNACLRLVLWG
jgi:hypothetical protein